MYKTIALEVINSLKSLNPNCINNMFQVKEKYITHDLRDSHIWYQPKFIKVAYGNILLAIMYQT